MEATLQLPEALAHRLEALAREEGTSLNSLLGLLVSEHVERRRLPVRSTSARKDVRFPLIPKEVTGVIGPFTGADIDELFALDDIAPRR